MYQQHYSPKKPVPKSSTSSLSIAAGGGNGAASLPQNICLLQTELLQLHLLHSQALDAKRKWEASADTKCRKLHESVATSYRSVLSSERSIQQNRNAAAIEQFAADIKASNSRYDLPSQIQMLSKVIQEVSDMTDPGEGRYSLVIQEFEEWSTRVQQIRQNRSQPTSNGNATTVRIDSEFVDPLSDAWKTQVAALSTKLELCSRELDCLEVSSAVTEQAVSDYDASALVKAVRGHRVLIQSMIQELDVMAKIEFEVVKLEKCWVKRNVEPLWADINQDIEIRIPAWKM
ncbi:predicted protein [Uncinocarpus reesii 1704]|uniref:Uncharacterized protein n=1 Tax=Uncinocarpus reesii (strain UAMH 1704) TaxID=336963 RepID=C4JVZ5_UNCRE|nr:uncharacterized protein UREG_06737 [Uncinocarpus reesii 1704]EEP81872.1 predicted protein [Uncinocarpus reesii 1704]